VLENFQQLRQGPPPAPARSRSERFTAPQQIDIIDRHVIDAREKGASVVAGATGAQARAGSTSDRPGQRRPHDGVHDGGDVRPTLPIMRVAGVDEPSASPTTRPTPPGQRLHEGHGQGEQIARRLEAGAVTINDAQVNYTVFDAPMGGWKSSGLGVRHGRGIRKYCKTQTILFNPLAPSATSTCSRTRRGARS